MFDDNWFFGFFLDSQFVQATKESDPEQYAYEMKEFKTYKDKNKDGKLDLVRYAYKFCHLLHAFFL